MSDEKKLELPPIDQYVAENYEAIVADPERNRSWKNIEDLADETGDVQLAAYARARAAHEGADVTPTAGVAEAPTKVIREEQQKTGEFKPVEFPVIQPTPAVDGKQLDPHRDPDDDVQHDSAEPKRRGPKSKVTRVEQEADGDREAVSVPAVEPTPGGHGPQGDK